jgi:hypothetical protein
MRWPRPDSRIGLPSLWSENGPNQGNLNKNGPPAGIWPALSLSRRPSGFSLLCPFSFASSRRRTRCLLSLLRSSPIVGSYDQRSATFRALLRSPAMSCRASSWSRPSLPAGPRFPTSARPRSPLGEVHELQSPLVFRGYLIQLLACCLPSGLFSDTGAYVQW